MHVFLHPIWMNQWELKMMIKFEIWFSEAMPAITQIQNISFLCFSRVWKRSGGQKERGVLQFKDLATRDVKQHHVVLLVQKQLQKPHPETPKTAICTAYLFSHLELSIFASCRHILVCFFGNKSEDFTLFFLLLICDFALLSSNWVT